jgi:transposase
MTEEFKDTIGEVLWFAMFATSLFTVPLIWKYLKIKKVYRIIIGLLLAAFLSFFLYFISLAIIFRDGMGPA